MYKVLFVCLGNICRSPAADGVLNHLVKKNHLSDKVFVDSAGTCANHIGENADSRMQAHAEQRGYKLTSIARQLQAQDLEEFDLILAMDTSNYQDILSLENAEKYKDKVKMFTSFCKVHERESVPDPYFGAADGFDLVMDIVEDGCQQILEQAQKECRA